jgi:hypothetical protein
VRRSTPLALCAGPDRAQGPRYNGPRYHDPRDYLVVAGVSNWGSYGVVAALSRLTGVELLHTPEIERRLIQACVSAGACEGVTRRREPTVDSLNADIHAGVVDLLRLAARSGIMGRGGRRTRS